MASGFFAVLDDITVLLDDVATMGKVAAKKTSSILGDDLAVNAEKASGFASERELPVLWAISKGSFLNKVIILPIAFLLSAYMPLTIIIILLIGGAYLGYEGVEKIISWIFHKGHQESQINISEMTEQDFIEHEKSRVKSAILTDFILSIEIIIIALGSVLKQPLLTQILVVSLIALVATVGVYGLVAIIVRMDEVGFKLIQKSKGKNSLQAKLGLMLVNALPKVIQLLSVIGTVALIFVAGGIFVHNVPYIHHLFHSVNNIVLEIITGLSVGFVTFLIVEGVKSLKFFRKGKSKA